jgi:hypothetical protein
MNKFIPYIYIITFADLFAGISGCIMKMEIFILYFSPSTQWKSTGANAPPVTRAKSKLSATVELRL